MAKHIGILTAGGDGPGLNAALRGVGKAALGAYGMGKAMLPTSAAGANTVMPGGITQGRWLRSV